MTQGERVNEVRKKSQLTMDQFGERLGVTKTAISYVVNGKRNLTEQMLKSICREFSVDEEWLRTGDGDMPQKLPGVLSGWPEKAHYMSEQSQG